MSLRGLMINDYVGDVQIMVIMLNDEEMMMWCLTVKWDATQ